VREPIIGEEDLFTQAINALAGPMLNPQGRHFEDDLDISEELSILGERVRQGSLAIALGLYEIAAAIRRANE
jgi:hypothetical protein